MDLSKAGLPAGVCGAMRRGSARREKAHEETRAARRPPPIRGFMFDVDGTLLLSDRSLGGYEVLPGAVETLNALREPRRARIVLLTNGSAYPPAEQAAQTACRRAAGRRRTQMITPSSVDGRTHDAQRGAARAGARVTTASGIALREVGIETRAATHARASRGRRRVRRLASGLRHEGHRGGLQCHLGRREAVRRLRRAVLRDAKQGRTIGYIVRDRRRHPHASRSAPMILTGKPSLQRCASWRRRWACR